MLRRLLERLVLVLSCVSLFVASEMVHPDRVYAVWWRDTHRQAPEVTYPQIWHVYVAYRTVNTGSNNMAFPYDNTDVVIRAIVVAYYNGQKRAYTDLTGAPSGWSDGGTWHVYGTQGWECPYEITEPWPDYRFLDDISALYGEVLQWDTAHWGSPTFDWMKRYHHYYAKSESYRKYDYHEGVPQSWAGWGTGTSGINFLTPGLLRLRVTAHYRDQTKTSPDNEDATRIAVRSTNNFGLDNEQRRVYLRWVFAYLSEPYQMGGYWFAGRASDEWVPQWGYTGHGIDCSGPVSCGARWAGYDWDPWRLVTCNMWELSYGSITDEFPQNDPFGPGDLLCYHIHGDPCEGHVVSVYYLNNDTVSIIEAAGGSPDSNPPGSRVRLQEGQSLENDWLTEPGSDPNHFYRQFRMVPQ